MPHTDKILICRNCGSGFTFTSKEQLFFARRGLMNEPSRCPSCRNARNGGISAAVESYIYYGPFASFDGRTPRQMHPAVCDTCGQMTEVPFLPRGDRPVYCSECFSKRLVDPLPRTGVLHRRGVGLGMRTERVPGGSVARRPPPHRRA